MRNACARSRGPAPAPPGGNAVVAGYWNRCCHCWRRRLRPPTSRRRRSGTGMITPDGHSPTEVPTPGWPPPRIPIWTGSSWMAPSCTRTAAQPAQTARRSRGFVMRRIFHGVTGARDDGVARPRRVGRRVKGSGMPVGVGLGVRSREQAAEDRPLRRRRYRQFRRWCRPSRRRRSRHRSAR